MKAATLPSPIYGSFESHPARYTSYESWVLFGDTWRQLGAYEVMFGAAPMSKQEFEKTYGSKLPPLPKRAFTSLPNAELKARLDDVYERSRKLYGKALENYSPEWRKVFGLD
jgi:hypothetical protein